MLDPHGGLASLALHTEFVEPASPPVLRLYTSTDAGKPVCPTRTEIGKVTAVAAPTPASASPGAIAMLPIIAAINTGMAQSQLEMCMRGMGITALHREQSPPDPTR
jgi:hypothetical protein